jgi:hypothetical protein
MSMPLIPPYAITASYQNSQFGSGNLYVPGVPSVLHHLVTPPTSASDAEAHSDAHGVAHGFTPYSAANEVQLVTISGSPTSGTFLLGWGNAATSPIAYNATSATVQTALRALVSMPLTAAGINDVQTVTITGGPTGGTFTLTFGGQTTSALAFNASPAAVQTALQALSTIGAGNVTVTGVAGTSYVLTFSGQLGSALETGVTGTATSLTGGTPGINVAHTTSGAGATYSVAVSGSTGGPYTVTFSGGLGNKDVQMLWADGGALRGGTNPNVTVTTSTQGKAAFVNRALLNTTRQYDGMKNFYDSASGNNLSTAP